ncbi:hypothetical protein PENTCL1PPCAC_174, partial [Pristionchus entomophagus]
SGFVGAKCLHAAGTELTTMGADGGCCKGGTADYHYCCVGGCAACHLAMSGSCIDRLNSVTGISDCPKSASLCSDAVYRNFMSSQCPKTCGYCTGSSTSSVATSTGCVDRVNPRTGVSDCPYRMEHCTNAIYRPLMRIQCPLSCGFCTSG